MPRQAVLFDPPQRRSPVKRMHVIDAGNNGPGPGMNAQFRCARCGHTSDWHPVKPTEARRGEPCPKCNPHD